MTPGVKLPRLVSLYSGVGAAEEGLRRAGINYDLVCFSEMDGASALSYTLLHGVPMEKNWRDAAYIDGTALKNIDILLHRASHIEDELSSSIWESVRIIEESKPKTIVWESLPDIISKKNHGIFYEYLEALGKIGYRSYYKILNSNDYGSPQNRRRMITVSVRGDYTSEHFVFPKPSIRKRKLSEFLDSEVGSYYSISVDILEKIVVGLDIVDNKATYRIKDTNEKGFLEAQEGDGIDWAFPGSLTRRNRVSKESCHTLTPLCSLGTIQDKIPRFFTPREVWRLQGFKDLQFADITRYGLTNEQLYRQAGEATNVDMAEWLFSELRKQNFI